MALIRALSPINCFTELQCWLFGVQVNAQYSTKAAGYSSTTSTTLARRPLTLFPVCLEVNPVVSAGKNIYVVA